MKAHSRCASPDATLVSAWDLPDVGATSRRVGLTVSLENQPVPYSCTAVRSVSTESHTRGSQGAATSPRFVCCPPDALSRIPRSAEFWDGNASRGLTLHSRLVPAPRPALVTRDSRRDSRPCLPCEAGFPTPTPLGADSIVQVAEAGLSRVRVTPEYPSCMASVSSPVLLMPMALVCSA